MFSAPQYCLCLFFVPLILCHCWVNDIANTGYGVRGRGISFTSLSAFRKQVIQLPLTLVGHVLQHGLTSRGAAYVEVGEARMGAILGPLQ